MPHPEANDNIDASLRGDTRRMEVGGEFAPGQVLGEKYKVVSCLGKGGMGLVYRVQQILINKEFALKTIDQKSMTDTAMRRFQQEARTTFSLDHPNIIAVKDFGVLDNQTPFLVMELVNGETLGDRITRTGCLTVDQTIQIFVQVCFGLAYAHECGIVHRDIKPNNIMLLKGLPMGAEGSVKILDFGIAKFAGHEGGEIQALTRTGEIFGSPLYMSPEQCSGFKVDNRADIYSLGCVMFEALTGTPPFMGDNALTTMMKHQSERAPTLKEASLGGDFPQALEDMVAKMLAKSPEHRYQSLGIVAHDLGALKRGDAVSRSAKPATKPPDTKTISLSIASFYALLIVITLLAGAVGYFVSGLRMNQQSKVEIPKQHEPVEESSQRSKQDANTVPSDQEMSSASSEKKLEDEDKLPTIPDTKLRGLLEARSETPNAEFNQGHTKFEGSQIALIAESGWIKTLELSGCKFENKNLGQLSKLPLESIKLMGSNLNDTGAEGISHCRGLHEIIVSDTGISDTGIGKLASIPHLKRLTICRTAVSELGLKALARCKTLSHLDLKGSQNIVNQSLVALEQSKLGDLDLTSTQVDDGGMASVAKIDSLNGVVLNQTGVTVNGIRKLLSNNNQWDRILISHCPNISAKERSQLQAEFPKVSFTEDQAKGQH